MIFIPSQFLIPFFVIMGLGMLVCGFIWFRESRGSKPASSHVKVMSKGHKHNKMMQMDFDVFTFQHLSDGTEFEMSLVAGRNPEIVVGETGTLEYVAVRGKPKYFTRFISETVEKSTP